MLDACQWRRTVGRLKALQPRPLECRIYTQHSERSRRLSHEEVFISDQMDCANYLFMSVFYNKACVFLPLSPHSFLFVQEFIITQMLPLSVTAQGTLLHFLWGFPAWCLWRPQLCGWEPEALPEAKLLRKSGWIAANFSVHVSQQFGMFYLCSTTAEEKQQQSTTLETKAHTLNTKLALWTLRSCPVILWVWALNDLRIYDYTNITHDLSILSIILVFLE